MYERFVGDSPYSNHGQRMINGQRMMPTDMFVGWTTNGGHDFYVRQRHDGKVVPKGRDHHRPVGEVRGRMRASAGPHTRAAVTPPRWNYYLGASAKVEQAFAGFASGPTPTRMNERPRAVRPGSGAALDPDCGRLGRAPVVTGRHGRVTAHLARSGHRQETFSCGRARSDAMPSKPKAQR